jgi:hypothetical protein
MCKYRICSQVEELGGAASEEGKKLMDKQKWGAMIDRAQV